MSASNTQIPGYELIRELGQGGMATVFLAIQRSLDRKVAIKVMKRNIDDLEKFERRFLIEGRTMAKLPHRNIVAVYDIVKNEDCTYIAMEFLDGGTLSQKMKDGLSLAEAISVVVQIGQSLQFAHEHGIVHRDLKPANIMFRDANTPVLTDFGIAKQSDAGATRLTQTGMLVGTPTYMSPEQINALEVDGRSDLYSLGILFYELLTGTPPFSADTPIAVLMAHLTTPPPPLPAGFADFQPVVDKMLAKNRDDRFPSLKDFTRSLKGAVVNNQNLWARLQGDPNQSSSEQLRALGFSVSGGEGMQGPSSGQVRLPPSGKGIPRTPTPRPMSPGYATGEMQPPPEKKAPWLLIGAAAAVVLGLGIGGWLLFGGGGVAKLDPNVQKLVDIALIQVDSEIAKKDVIAAMTLLRTPMELAPNYQGTLDRMVKIVQVLKADANAAIAAKDLDTAYAKVEQAKLIVENDPELKTLSDRIAGERNSAAQAQAIAGVLKKADDASRAGRDFGPGGAYAILSEAQTETPNPQVKQRLDALVERALKPARDALARNDLATAQTGVAGVQAALANEAAWQKLKADIDGAVANQAARTRLAGMLASIDAQIRAGKLSTPAGDNAQETLGRLMAANAKDPEVLRRQDQLAGALTTQAQASLTAGQIEQALQSANVALNVKPDFAAALSVKRSAEGRLDANRARVLDGLGKAQQALADGRFLSPANNSAKFFIDGVLQLDPRNVEALGWQQQLPKRIADAAQARATAGDLDAAGKLIDEGRRAYPADTALASLGANVTQQLAAEKTKADRAKEFERISQLLAARPVKAENIGNAARSIAGLLRANPNDVDAATARTRMFELLDNTLANADSSADLDALAAALRAAQQQFATDPMAQKVATGIEASRQRIAAEEQARLAAISGELVLNASPWATVESVVDANRKPVKLPTDTTTPLRLALQEGVYTVTFKHPQVGRPSTQVAQVRAKQSTTASGSFPSISSKDYLKRAGW